MAFIALGGEIVQQLWNRLLPPLFGWRELTFWQALGMLVLCRILFGGFGFNNSDQSKSRRHMGARMADRVTGRMEAMSPEEREQLRQGMRTRCGQDPSTSESPEQ
ncbi:MAG TPA: hypothetical protein VKR61_06125 [Bryobacteraceae bacterium]|nr:hypothetical protein [Bryobacteraceae bacterium]